jgi:site-specific DNA-methyltransferase (cytosine-N4-specific)
MEAVRGVLTASVHSHVVSADVTNPEAFAKALASRSGRDPSSKKFDAVITSPPYASALPYVDTQRLSLVWLQLVPAHQLAKLQSDLVGSREFYGTQKSEWARRFQSNIDSLPQSVSQFCNRLQDSLSARDGFRRKVVPVLLYRYLVGMQNMFRAIRPYLAKSAPFALIVGQNHTTLGGRRFDIDTPSLLAEIAGREGFRDIEHFELQTYQRYSIHRRNAVCREELLVCK